MCKNSAGYNRTRNFGLYGHAESKETQKFVFRSALRPNQISFSHDQDPKRTLAPNIGQRASRRTRPAAITKAIVALIANSQPYRKIKSDFFVRDHWRASEENNLLGSGILCTVPEFH